MSNCSSYGLSYAHRQDKSPSQEYYGENSEQYIHKPSPTQTFSRESPIRATRRRSPSSNVRKSRNRSRRSRFLPSRRSRSSSLSSQLSRCSSLSSRKSSNSLLSRRSRSNSLLSRRSRHSSPQKSSCNSLLSQRLSISPSRRSRRSFSPQISRSRSPTQSMRNDSPSRRSRRSFSPQRSRSRSPPQSLRNDSPSRKSRSPVRNSEKRPFVSSPRTRTRTRFFSYHNVQRHTIPNSNKVYHIPTFQNSKNIINSHRFNYLKDDMNTANTDLQESNAGKNSFMRPYNRKKYNVDRNITNYMPSRHKGTSKKFEEINQKPTASFTISEITRGNETVKGTDTKPRLLFQTPKFACESSLRTPLIHKTIISDARADIIDFILKFCIRLQLPMTIVAAVLQSYHKYHEYNSKRKINWHGQFIDEFGFDDELLGISCILIEIENTKYFKGIRKATTLGWRLKYPNVPLDDCDKLKKTVKIMMSNVKNAIGRESLNKTPIDSASRVIQTLKDEFELNANPLFNKFVQNVWTMIINCLCSTRIAMTYSSDELATAFCAESGGSNPLRIKDAILDIVTMKQGNQFSGVELT
ncbi:19146_t:CDS:2 [Cetraspora pellucida]|uniref:19146_t:CDS:1 n=1 Tax=Cetraspora pellucida TaxID=1433469 RepID=A0A9N9GXK4_9GLOM|nr:19146_t:CDS:2 [Cetraspora pellucida]